MAAPRKENTKELVLKAAERLLESKNLSDISLAEIAEAAGISKGTLYYHYKSKTEILFDLTDRYLSEQWSQLISWTEDSSKDTSLHRLVKYVAERDVSSASIRLHLINAAMLGDEVTREKLLQRYKQFEKLISEKIAERTDAIPADFLAWLILLASDGLLVQSALGNPDFDSAAFIDQSSRYIKDMNK